MRYYIASRLENAPRVRELKSILDVQGWNHTYDWTVHGSVQSAGPEVIAEVARAEARGVEMAQVVIVLLPGGRGTHTELGMSIAWHMAAEPRRTILLSESAEIDFGQDGRTCCFYHHPAVERVSTWGDLLAALGVVQAS